MKISELEKRLNQKLIELLLNFDGASYTRLLKSFIEFELYQGNIKNRRLSVVEKVEFDSSNYCDRIIKYIVFFK